MLQEDKQVTGNIELSTEQLVRTRRQHNQHVPRETDILPRVNTEASSSRAGLRQLTQLREENQRLRCELSRQRTELQNIIAEYNHAQDQFDQEVIRLQRSHQLEIEQYQSELKEIMDERNQLHEEFLQARNQYEELYQSYHDAVDEEAQKMVSEAAKTLELAPDSMPPLLHEVAQTLELQMKQVEDQHIAEALYLMRESQRKTELLENDLEEQRNRLIEEQQKLAALQDSIREQAELRYKTQKLALRSRWTAAFTMMTTALLVLLPLLQLIIFSQKWPLFISLFAPVLACIALAGLFAYLRSRTSEFTTHLPKKKAA